MVGKTPEGTAHQLRFPDFGFEPEARASREYIHQLCEYLPPNDATLIWLLSYQLSVVAYQFTKIPKLRPIALLYQSLGEQALAEANSIKNVSDLQTILKDPGAPEVGEIQRIKVPKYPVNRAFNIEEASALSMFFKNRGDSIAFTHGHLRTLTPSSIIYLLNAQRQADVLFLGVETSQRTEQYKQKKVFFTDSVRGELFRGLYPFTFFIDNTVPYNSDGYAQLLTRISPHKYIGQSGNPEWLKLDMQQSANSLGIEYVELQTVPGFSTSSISKLFEEFFGEW